MMIRHPLFPSVLALSFLVGCAGEESAAPEAAPPTPAPVPAAPAVEDKAPAEATPAPEKKEADDAAKAPELTPAPEKAEDGAAATDEKKPEAADKAPAPEDKKADAKPSLEGPSAEAGAVKLSDEDLAEVKKLPADEQAAALAQAACPVSKHGLGSMGVPIKVSAEGRTFYICCEGCQKKIKNDPKAVVAELDKLMKK